MSQVFKNPDVRLNEMKHSISRKTALIAVLAALCIGTNYVMLPLPNINLMDAIVFTTGLFYGFIPGASVATIAWLVYGSLNPLGFSAPILLVVIAAEMIYAFVGSRLHRTSFGHPHKEYGSVERYLVFGVAGLFATIAYDIITNAVSGLLAYNSIWIGLITMNVPLPLGIIHAASNFILFATITPLLLKLLAKGVVPKNL
jgi:uncharacterized membrane protein